MPISIKEKRTTRTSSTQTEREEGVHELSVGWLTSGRGDDERRRKNWRGPTCVTTTTTATALSSMSRSVAMASSFSLGIYYCIFLLFTRFFFIHFWRDTKISALGHWAEGRPFYLWSQAQNPLSFFPPISNSKRNWFPRKVFSFSLFVNCIFGKVNSSIGAFLTAISLFQICCCDSNLPFPSPRFHSVAYRCGWVGGDFIINRLPPPPPQCLLLHSQRNLWNRRSLPSSHSISFKHQQ